MNDVSISVGMAGRYRLQVRGPDGEVRRDSGWFNNLILDAGLNRIGTGAVGTYCQVGSGSNTPNVADTSLQSFIASTGSVPSSTNDRVDGAEKYGFTRYVYRFAAGVAAGNISEVGVGWTSASGNLFSRALVIDEFGTPNTITVLSDEVLDVTYELRIYVPTVDVPYSMTIAGVEYTGVVRAAQFNGTFWAPAMILNNGTNYSNPLFNAYQGPLGAITATPSGSNNSGSLAWDTYSNNSLQRTGVATFNLTSGNLSGGIGAFYLYVYGSWAFQFSVEPKIPKDNTKVMTIRVTTSWARKTI